MEFHLLVDVGPLVVNHHTGYLNFLCDALAVFVNLVWDATNLCREPNDSVHLSMCLLFYLCFHVYDFCRYKSISTFWSLQLCCCYT
ncbi:hypothetical protein MT325_m211R [Paramecium bursaria chlorella virus MT325]|uniref:Uncharacterized protein m211R n=1 Tax=Paramecium bursaria Chlorella virus MT325 TaxID=346932 RepID=A7ITU1_PBCVM|nr:hypothetical protein MT325_m211R [Paramecium bursaria chlorella virus MT325]